MQKKIKREKIKPLPRFRHTAAIEYNNDQKYFKFVERQKIFTTCTVLHFIKQLGSTEKLVCTCTNSFNVLSNLRNNKSKRNLLRPNSQYCFSDKRLLLSGDIELNPGPSAKNTRSSDKLITTNVILENRLDELGLRPLDVGGEGDCFFRAISHQLYNDSSHHLDIRASGVQYMRESPERFIESNVENSWEQYLTSMSTPGTWGDHLVIQASCFSDTPDFVSDNERDHILNLAPGEGNRPMSIFRDRYSEELAYPGIFLGQKRPDNTDRFVDVHYSEICKSELRRSDRRAAMCVENIFFKTKKLQMKILLGQSQVALRKCQRNGGTITAGQLKQPGAINNMIHHDQGFKFLRALRGSPPYFEKAKKDIFAMIRQLGAATLFCSFSSAETQWIHLLRILGKLVDKKDYTDNELENLNWENKTRLIQSDPVTCARHFDFQINKLIQNFLLSEASPLGKIADWFYRVEYQQRGSPHIHMLIWLENAPTFGVDFDCDIVSFIDKIITCEKPIDNPELLTLVNRQVHRHSHTCRKKSKSVCRFNYPQPPMRSTNILYPLDTVDMDDNELNQHKDTWKFIKKRLNDMKEGDDITFDQLLVSLELTEQNYLLAVRSSLKAPTIFLRRKPNELRVNNNNPACLSAWRANMDIQFVLDVYACAMYIVSYISKAQKGMSDLLRTACEEARKGNSSIKQQVRDIGNKFLNNVEISAQEAVYIVLQLPMRKSSRQVVFISTSPPEDRVQLLKPLQEINDMEDDSDEVYASDLITRYTKRPAKLENLSLADWAAWYDSCGKPYVKPSREKDIDNYPLETSLDNNDDDDTEVKESEQKDKKRTKARIIRSVCFNKVLILRNITVN